MHSVEVNEVSDQVGMSHLSPATSIGMVYVYQPDLSPYWAHHRRLCLSCHASAICIFRALSRIYYFWLDRLSSRSRVSTYTSIAYIPRKSRLFTSCLVRGIMHNLHGISLKLVHMWLSYVIFLLCFVSRAFLLAIALFIGHKSMTSLGPSRFCANNRHTRFSISTPPPLLLLSSSYHLSGVISPLLLSLPLSSLLHNIFLDHSARDLPKGISIPSTSVHA